MNLNGARSWTRLSVSMSRGRIRVFLGPSMTGTPIIDYTDPSPLPAGTVGLHTIGMQGVVFDNVVLNDDPLCSDGIFNGDEEGVDCGGSCASPCPSTGQTFTWDFTVQGHGGWQHHTYGNEPNGNFFGAPFVYTPAVDGVTMPTNANGLLPGSTGSLALVWTGSWWLVPSQQPPMLDIDFTVEVRLFL